MGEGRTDDVRERIAAQGIDETVAAEETIAPATIATPPSGDGADDPLGSLPRITLGGAEGASFGTHDTGPDLREVAVLGEGGMGRILLARQSSLGREVAVKTLRNEAPSSDATALVREARITGALEHPSIVPVHALGVDQNGLPLLVMKRVEGVSWRTLISDPKHPAWSTHFGATREPLDVHLEILIAVCRAVELAHDRGILHRDIKPANVMVGAFGEVYLVDWGVATTKSGRAASPVLVGTPSFMAPELACCEPADELTDVYLLGATLHNVLTKRSRHAGNVVEAILAAVRSAPATYEALVPAQLADLANRACARERSRRPQSVTEFRETLVSFRRHRSALAICETAGERVTRLERLLADADGAPPSDLALAYRLASEARFGFAQSLEQFPEQHEPRLGRLRCQAALIDLELAQGHVETAAAMLEEIPDAPSTFAEKIATARKTAAARAREQERLIALDRDLDPAVEKGARLTAVIVVLAIGLGIGLVIRRGSIGAEGVSPERLVAILGCQWVGTIIGMLILRKRLLASALNRRLAALALVTLTVLVANRVLGLLRSTPVQLTFSSDLLLCTACVAIGGVTTLRRILFALPILIAGLVAIELRPTYAAEVFPAATLVMLGVIAWAVRAAKRTSAS